MSMRVWGIPGVEVWSIMIMVTCADCVGSMTQITADLCLTQNIADGSLCLSFPAERKLHSCILLFSLLPSHRPHPPPPPPLTPPQPQTQNFLLPQHPPLPSSSSSPIPPHPSLLSPPFPSPPVLILILVLLLLLLLLFLFLLLLFLFLLLLLLSFLSRPPSLPLRPHLMFARKEAVSRWLGGRVGSGFPSCMGSNTYTLFNTHTNTHSSYTSHGWLMGLPCACQNRLINDCL